MKENEKTVADKTIADEAYAYVRESLLEKLSPSVIFHNFEHTEEITEVCEELAEKAGLEEEEREVLLLAALFENTGFTEEPGHHLPHSAAIAREFLEKKGYPVEKINKIAALLESLQEDQVPETQLEKILHDANWSFLGRKRFERRGRLLRLEQEYVKGKKYSLYDWNKELLELQMSVKFYTPWAHDEYTKRRNKNIASQREEIVSARKKTVRKKTGKDFGRGVDTIYRVTLRNHINLSSIADGKANMIISINTLVLSILITAGSAGFSMVELGQARNLHFVIPVLILMITSLSAIIFAVFSAIPKISGVEFTKEDVRDHKVSLLYFGNFLKLPKDEFVTYLRNLKEDQEVLYDDLSKDLYNLGAVLRKKYRLLTVAYRVFVGGLVVSVATFLVMYLFI